MPAARARARKAGQAARAARQNPYIQRLVEDADLRDELRHAIDAGRHAYGRMSNGKGPTRAIMEDRKVQRDLREAAASLRKASASLREGPRKRKRGLGRLLVIGIVGAGLALALSESARKKVLDALFGAEEEFEYTPTATPAPAPEPAATT